MYSYKDSTFSWKMKNDIDFSLNSVWFIQEEWSVNLDFSKV
jgi:hypothetical protein